ncbi:hypothetical protein [Vibrio cyclitrophicus]|uniref:hypothetical protein n=1 Tax=Vibrio cyclitrophicus TaxID=47951 RepID=UPI000C85ECCC|nr:hypothetical protein [Vibrio cyclitrophicus]PMG81980.1 hypothetical protein BCU82_05980 [Vibrio cyclitrophicus]
MTKKSNTEIRNVREELEKAQSRSRARTLSLDNFYEKVSTLQQILDDVLYKHDQRGIEASITFYTKVASTYNVVPQATFVDLVRNTKAWKLVGVRRDTGIPADIQIHNLDKYKEQIAYKITRDTQRIVCPDIQD